MKSLLEEEKTLPLFFKPILWSYNFSAINPEKHKETIIINTVNYGDLKHWRWIAHFYGENVIADVLRKIPVSELRPAARRLASIIFSIKDWNNAPRGVKR